MKPETMLKMWLLVFDKHGQMAHATIDGHPLLFASRKAVRRAIQESKEEGIKVRPMRVEAFLRAGYSLEPKDKYVDPAILHGETTQNKSIPATDRPSQHLDEN